MADTGPDVLGDLLAAKWRDIEFPTTRFRLSIAHDLVEHKYWGVDGARVESTGLAPLRFTFSSPLLNGISPGRRETWAALYPNQFRILVAAFQKKERGTLQHPEFGPIVCKAERFDVDWEASRRGGVDAELSFVETTVADIEVRDGTPVSAVDIGEIDDETFKADLKTLLQAAGLSLPPYLQGNKVSLTDFFNSVKAVADYPSLLSYRAGGRINSILYHAKAIQKSADKARDATTWPVTQNVERIKEGAFGLRERLVQANRTIGKFTVPAATTLAGVARQIEGAKIGDLIALNPGLMRGPEIDKGTVVRYYKAA
jgi:hypothetical protein